MPDCSLVTSPPGLLLLDRLDALPTLESLARQLDSLGKSLGEGLAARLELLGKLGKPEPPGRRQEVVFTPGQLVHALPGP